MPVAAGAGMHRNKHTSVASILIALVLGSVTTASGDDRARLAGRVIDPANGRPVDGVLVLIAGPEGLDRTVTTDAEGRYATTLAAGTYHVVFVHGTSRTSGRVEVASGRTATLDGRVDSTAGEVIVIRDLVPPPVLPKPRNYVAQKAPPYSDAAVLSNAWTKAWLLLDIDERGRVARFKFLKRPGYDLEKIAAQQVFELDFDPARDANDRPVATLAIWQIEWPSAWWLQAVTGTRSAMPKVVGFPPRRQDQLVPCAGSAPWRMGSVGGTVYRDCSKPDLSKANTETWIVRPAASVSQRRLDGPRS